MVGRQHHFVLFVLFIYPLCVYLSHWQTINMKEQIFSPLFFVSLLQHNWFLLYNYKNLLLDAIEDKDMMYINIWSFLMNDVLSLGFYCLCLWKKKKKVSPYFTIVNVRSLCKEEEEEKKDEIFLFCWLSKVEFTQHGSFSPLTLFLLSHVNVFVLNNIERFFFSSTNKLIICFFYSSTSRLEVVGRSIANRDCWLEESDQIRRTLKSSKATNHSLTSSFDSWRRCVREKKED